MNYPEFALYFPLLRGKKTPALKGDWRMHATNDAKKIERWKALGYGIAATPVDGYAVLDLDVKPGEDGIAWAAENRPALPRTWRANTAGKGQHHWFKLPSGVRLKNKTRFLPGMDLRAAGRGYVVWEATIDGKSYVQHSASVADCPQWIIDDANAAKGTDDKFADDGSAVIEYKGAAFDFYKEAVAQCDEHVEAGADGWDVAANTFAWYTAHMMCHADGEAEADRLEEFYLNHELVTDLDANSDNGTRGSAKLGYKLAILRPQYAYREELEQDKEAEFWASTPALSRVARVAEISSANPWAVLGNTLARAAVTTNANVRADRRFTGGSKGGNLNLFIAPCGPAGAGKGEAFKAAGSVFQWPEVKEINIGSGEALLMNLKNADSYGEEGEVFYPQRQGLLVRTGEVGELGAKAGRQGSTLWEYLKQAYSGEALRNSTIAGKSDADIEDNSYRVAVSVDVQPLRADVLLEQADGGLPQRFVWFDARPAKVMKAADRTGEMLTELDDAPVFVNPFGEVVQEPVFITFPKAAFLDYDADKEARLARDESEDNDDAHAFYTRIKVAALLAILHGHKTVSEQLWAHSGYVMEHSAKRLDKCRALLANQETVKAQKRAQSMATMEHFKSKVQKELTQAEMTSEDYAKVVLEDLKASGRVTRRDFNAKVNGSLRPKRNDAITLLLERGAIVEEKEGRKSFLTLAA